MHMEALRALLANPIRKTRRRVVFTGHSLGGACAILLRHRLCSEMRDTDLFERSYVYTFGAPLVFARHNDAPALPLAASDFARVHCFVHNTDLVPRLLGSEAMRALVARHESKLPDSSRERLQTAQNYVPVGNWYFCTWSTKVSGRSFDRTRGER